LMGICR